MRGDMSDEPRDKIGSLYLYQMSYVFLSLARHWAQHFTHMIIKPLNNPARH